MGGFSRSIKFLSGALASRLEGRPVPLFVGHTINFRCNLSCSYCGTWREKTRELPTGKILGMIDSFARAGTVSWNLSGGEPLLRKDLGKIIGFAKQRGLAVSVNTNGVLVSEKLDELRELDLLSVSLDGGAREHDLMRGKGSFRKAVEGIVSARGAGIKTSIMAVISPATLSSGCKGVRDAVALSKKLGVQIAFQPMHGDPYNKIGGGKDYHPAVFRNPNYQKAISLLESEKRKNPWQIRMSWSYLRKLRRVERHNCFAGRNFCIIFPDGKLAPCFVKSGGSRLAATPGNFRKLARFPSCFCHFNCYSEWNSLLSFEPGSVSHYLSNYLRG